MAGNNSTAQEVKKSLNQWHMLEVDMVEKSLGNRIFFLSQGKEGADTTPDTRLQYRQQQILDLNARERKGSTQQL